MSKLQSCGHTFYLEPINSMPDQIIEKPTEREARMVREYIRIHGSGLCEHEYEVLMDFGQWFADEANADDVILSDWTPLETVTS